jgi:hypothetical protein
MMMVFMMVLIAAGCVYAFADWRRGVFWAIFVGMVQDPVRKLIPGTSAMLTMASVPIWLTVAIAALRQNRDAVRAFLETVPRLAKWLTVFCVYLAIPASISATYGRNSWQITLLGILVYGMAFSLIVAGWLLAADPKDRMSFAKFYIICGCVFFVGGPLEFLGLFENIKIIGTQVLGHEWATNRVGGTLYMLSGLFRSPDVMGWHAVMVLMFSIIVALQCRGKERAFWIAAGVWAFLNLWICGRRKMLSMIPIFLGTYVILLLRFKRSRLVFSLIALLMFIFGVGWYFIEQYTYDEKVEAFYITTLGEWDDRLSQHGYHAVVGTIKQAGFWGYGLGMSQQGVHNIDADKPRLWQEAGPSKLFAELGVPGSILFAVVALVLFRTCYEVVRVKGSAEDGIFFAGLLAVLLANFSSSIVSAQIFGDPFVIILLSVIIGMQLSGGRANTNTAEGTCE